MRVGGIDGRLLARRLRAVRIYRHLGTMSETHLATNTAFLSLDDVNGSVLKAEYAVRGELAIRAEEIKKVVKNGHDLRECFGFIFVFLCRSWRTMRLLFRSNGLSVVILEIPNSSARSH